MSQNMPSPLTIVLSETSNGSTLHYWQGLDVLAQSDGTQTEYMAYDGLGSVRQVTDNAGLVKMAQTFDPYGNLYSRSGVNPTNYAFTGEQQDSNGLLFLRARYYSAGMGRFLNTDPSRQEKNPYLYGLDNPVLRTDPSGFLSVGPLVLSDPVLDTIVFSGSTTLVIGQLLQPCSPSIETLSSGSTGTTGGSSGLGISSFVEKLNRYGVTVDLAPSISGDAATWSMVFIVQATDALGRFAKNLIVNSPGNAGISETSAFKLMFGPTHIYVETDQSTVADGYYGQNCGWGGHTR